MITGARYIGKKVFDDAGAWKRYLGSGTHLKRAIQKYGVENFQREFLSFAASNRELNEQEKYWISYFDAVASNDFYNIAAGGDGGNINGLLPPERKKEIYLKAVESRKPNLKRGEDIQSSVLKEENVYEIIELLLKNEYDDVIGAKYGVSHSTINDIRLHKTWNHLTQGIVFPRVKKRVFLRNKEVLQYSMDGTFLARYASAREAESITGICYKQISACCNGSKHTSHGFIFVFDENQIPNRIQIIEQKKKYMRYD